MNDSNQKLSVLIVDDFTEDLDVLKSALKDDFMVRPATNGLLALRLAVMNPQPDIILLDVVMPDMDGYEVCRQLKRNRRTADIPVIFITGKTGDQNELEGFMIGAVDYITKPISPPVVLARIRTHLAVRHFNREMEEKNRRLSEINERLNDSLEQLSASEDRFRSLVQTIPDIVYKIDSEGRFTFLNRAVERLGYHQSELIGKHFTEIIYSADVKEACLEHVIDRIGRGTANPGRKVFDERRTGVRMTVGLEIRLRAKGRAANELFENKNLETETVGVEVNSTGLYGDVGNETSYRSRQYIGTVGVIRDITDRQRVQMAFMEERKLLSELINAVPLPIFFVDSRYQFIFANDAFLQLTGTDHRTLEESGLGDTFGQENSKPIADLIGTLLADLEHQHQHTEITLVSKEGRKHTVIVMLSKFHRHSEEKPAVIGVMVDVTEQKQLTNQLVEARTQAEEMALKAEVASRAKGEFLANMSHEIRTPLNAVIGLTHLCLQTELSWQQRDYLNKVTLSANSLLSLINDILDFSRIEAGKLVMETIPFSVDDVLGGVAAVLSVKAQEKGLEFLVTIAEGVPAFLMGDSHRFGQIFANLAGNAVKFTSTGEVEISMAIAEVAPEGILLKCAVRDTGIGLTPEQMNGLFQEFFQADSSTTRKYGGTGLGLAISKRLVAMMGGEIHAMSTPGLGSSFTFTARFGKCSEPLLRTALPTMVIPEYRALIVDDNAHAREILAGYLGRMNWSFITAADGFQALEHLAHEESSGTPVDFVFLDWKMPEMNGMEVAKRIKQDARLTRTPRIIMVTAHARDEVAPQEELRGLLDGYLLKPVTRQVLTETVAVVLGLSSFSQTMASNPDRDMVAGLGGAHVLLVDDNEINQQVSREILQQVGVKVTVAGNGREAVATVTQGTFDAILMDVQMPVMDGYDATRKIRQLPEMATLPIIAMTANAMSGDREKCLQSGMNDHVAKPVSPSELYAALCRWLPQRGRGIAKATPASAVTDEECHLPPLPGINTTKGLINTGGNLPFYRAVLHKFALNQGSAPQRMAQELSSGNGSGVGHIAHALKGVAATIGAIRVAELAGHIEKKSKSEGEMAEMLPLLTQMEVELGHVVAAINSLDVDNIEKNLPDPGAGEQEEVGVELLKSYFDRAIPLLQSYDSTAVNVIQEMVPLALRGERRERLRLLQEALARYDFDSCLVALKDWAGAENIQVGLAS